ncbi:ATP-dependent RNA helicase RhlE [hydrothermal vent metagenome]|uniref:ATP-dependent RNA helicase RhlE n=1 Tax=hydrothermal vent metagenome TaxID=652676 RepID=A0A3B1E8V9_9ZZZZ
MPTRELVDQISIAISIYGEFLKIRHTKIHGGLSISSQLDKLSTGIDIIIATPGRLKGFIEDDNINVSSVNIIVLDEADTMLEMGFIKDIEFILSKCSKQRQIMMFSATISQNIKKLAKEFLHKPVTIEISQRRDVVSLIHHLAYKVDLKQKHNLLLHLIKKDLTQQILVFVLLRDDANYLTSFLVNNGISAVTINGHLDYTQRSKNIKSFKAKKSQVLVATDIAGRGIDIKDLYLVINFELPQSTDDFTHRVGRTGRAGQKGNVISILTIKDYSTFTKIERNLKLNIKRIVEDGFELKDRQPRQKQMKKKSLSIKKGKLNKDSKKQKNKSNRKKITKRDTKRVFRK